MPENLTLISEEPRSRGIAIYVTISLALHLGFLVYWYLHRPEHIATASLPARYVELVQSVPFREAPGKKLERPSPPDAPFSDANRSAASDRRSGEHQVDDPGDGKMIGGQTAQPQQSPSASPPAESAPPRTAAATLPPSASVSRTHVAASAASVDWRGALQQIARGPSAEAPADDTPGGVGGEEGFAESGPVSFETQWYDWGDYAESMVRRIRRNWYDNMPELIKVGMQGIVTIRFTIEKSGRISDVTLLKSSGVPPFDNAARKAIELSSPLMALPKDFPNPRERVTAQFYYNVKPPRR